MALPKFLQFGKSYADRTVDLSKDTSPEVIDASQTSGSTIDLGSGTTLFSGDNDFVYTSSGADTVYNARNGAIVAGSGASHDTFVFGVGSKPQQPGMIGNAVVDDSAYQGETIQISKNFLNSQQLAIAIANANAEPQGTVDANGRTLVIDGKGDSIAFLSGDKLSVSQFKLV